MLNYLEILHSHYEEYHPEEKLLGDVTKDVSTDSTPNDEKLVDGSNTSENIVSNKTIDEDITSECNIPNEIVSKQPLVDLKTSN